MFLVRNLFPHIKISKTLCETPIRTLLFNNLWKFRSFIGHPIGAKTGCFWSARDAKR